MWHERSMIGFAVAALLGLSGVLGGAEQEVTGPHKPSQVSDPVRSQRAACELDAVAARTGRIFGRDRYETAAQISVCTGWEYDNTLIVYLASGQDYPDALGMGASTLGLGPLLLSERTTLPAPTRAELAALRPCLVIAAGGPRTISQSVLEQADAYTVACDL